jgi:tRNA dimethylallyltransferase
VDACSASRIDPHNVRRIIRALEVYRTTGVPFSKARLRIPLNFPVFVLGLTMERERLNFLLECRVDTMLRKGWVEEVKLLLEQGYSPNLPSFSTLGYNEVVEHISGSLSSEEAANRIKILHKRFSRRQHAWFRQSDARIHWINVESATFRKAEFLIDSFLGTSTRL